MATTTEYYGFTFSSVSTATPELTSAQRGFKIALLVINTVFLVGGACMCAFGAYALNSDAAELSGATLPAAVIVLGVFTLIMSLMGCGAAAGESRFLLSIYFAVLLLIAVVSLVVGIVVLAERDSISGYLIDGWNAAPASTHKYIQGIFSCCGLTNSDGAVDCPANITQSCLSVLDDNLQGHFEQAGAVCIVFSVFMIVSMIIVCILMKGIKDKRMLEELRERHRRLRAAKSNPRSFIPSTYNTGLPPSAHTAALHAAQTSLNESAVDGVRRYDRSSMLQSAQQQQQQQQVHADGDEDDDVAGTSPDHVAISIRNNAGVSPAAAAASSSPQQRGKLDRRNIDDDDTDDLVMDGSEEEEEDYRRPPPRRGALGPAPASSARPTRAAAPTASSRRPYTNDNDNDQVLPGSESEESEDDDYGRGRGGAGSSSRGRSAQPQPSPQPARSNPPPRSSGRPARGGGASNDQDFT